MTEPLPLTPSILDDLEEKAKRAALVQFVVVYVGHPEQGRPAILESEDCMTRIYVDCSRNFGNPAPIAEHFAAAHPALVTALVQRVRELEEGLTQISTYADDQDLSHRAFRIDAAKCARALLTPKEPT